MIKLPDLPLPPETAAKLAELQQQVDQAGDYPARVAEGKAAFGRHNKASDRVFNVVRMKLEEIAGGLRRCAYCEDSMADEVEHIAPKDLFPEKVFAWQNYLYACGPCNGSNKKGQFKVRRHADGLEVDITRKPRSPIVQPEDGTPLFINQRMEDPMNFLELDISGTFQFLPRYRASPEDKARAIYTRDLLGLNRREALREGRKVAFTLFRSTLRSYDSEKHGANTAALLAGLKDAITNAPHQTVWQEMKRNRERIAELKPLFDRNPEVLDWQ